MQGRGKEAALILDSNPSREFHLVIGLLNDHGTISLNNTDEQPLLSKANLTYSESTKCTI